MVDGTLTQIAKRVRAGWSRKELVGHGFALELVDEVLRARDQVLERERQAPLVEARNSYEPGMGTLRARLAPAIDQRGPKLHPWRWQASSRLVLWNDMAPRLTNKELLRRARIQKWEHYERCTVPGGKKPMYRLRPGTGFGPGGELTDEERWAFSSYEYTKEDQMTVHTWKSLPTHELITQVEDGDSLETIAARYGVAVDHVASRIERHKATEDTSSLTAHKTKMQQRSSQPVQEPLANEQAAAATSSTAIERDAWAWQPNSALAKRLGVSSKQLDHLVRRGSPRVAHIERREATEGERRFARQRYVVRVKPNGPARLLDAKEGWTDDPTGAGADVDARLITGLHEKATDLEAELEDARATISRLEVEAQAAEDEAHLQASAVDASAEALTDALAERDELVTQIEATREERAADAATIEELRAERDAHLKVIEAQDARTVELEQELADARERLASIHSSALFDLEEKLATLEQNQAGICAELDELDQAGVILSPLCAKSVIDWYRRRLA